MIRKCIIRIELLSDMCVSDGSAYNSLIDTEICSDMYGFPFIPAKRIRGCLRECAVELNDWGDTVNAEALFGDAARSGSRSKVRISNAYLENYDEYRSFAAENKGHVLLHPQNVIGAFSYIRTQTSIDYDTGVADDNSLRNIRVANKGLVFIAEADVDEAYYEDLGKCCKVLRHMGIHRTRGLGEVRVSLEAKSADPGKETDHAPLADGATELKYEIDLLEPVICKSVNGEEANTADYIEGAKILGLISEELSEDFMSFMNKGELKCMNAYISSNGRRFTEVPGYIYRIKNDSGRFVNKLAENETNRKETEKYQLNQMKHSYAILEGGMLEKLDVLTEERYHHRRPEDKSIGRAAASEEGNADFYQMDSISEGQQFAGIITGGPDQIKEIYRILTQEKDFYIGYSRSSEYGKVCIRVKGTSGTESKQPAEATSIVVCLNAPTIVYNDRAMTTTDPDTLAAEILSALDIKLDPEECKVDKFIRYKTIGGYNVTWNMRKPTLQTFDKGTAVRLTFKEPVSVSECERIMLGERTAEGYGEASVSIYDPQNTAYVGKIKKTENSKTERTVDASSEFAGKLAKPLLDAFLRRKAAEAVEEKEESFKEKKDTYKPTVSNMMLMVKESSNIDEVRESAKERYNKKSSNKEAKRDVAEKILAKADSAVSLIEEFAAATGINGLRVDPEKLKMEYLKEYLTQIKYILKGDDKDE